MSKPVFPCRFLCYLVFLSVILIIASGCGRPVIDEAYSPKLVSVHSTGGCTGGEKDQFIAADLVFDKSIRMADDAAGSLRVTIGGERVQENRMDLSVRDSHTLHIVIPVDKVTSGVLKIAPLEEERFRGITDGTGKYAASPFSVDTLVPSGVGLELISSEEGFVEAEVTATASHRSIAWILIRADGKAVRPEGSGTDIMDQAVAVHEHDFLWATAESTAADIVETVQRYYPGRLTAESEGNRVMLRSSDPEIKGVLSIEIYTY